MQTVFHQGTCDHAPRILQYRPLKCADRTWLDFVERAVIGLHKHLVVGTANGCGLEVERDAFHAKGDANLKRGVRRLRYIQSGVPTVF